MAFLVAVGASYQVEMGAFVQAGKEEASCQVEMEEEASYQVEMEEVSFLEAESYQVASSYLEEKERIPNLEHQVASEVVASSLAYLNK